MAVVAPLSAVMAAALPVVVGLSTGERPGVLPTTGLLIALPALWLVSSADGRDRANRSDVISGLSAGLGFGLQFAALGQVAAEAGLTALALSQAVSVIAIAVAGAIVSGRLVPGGLPSRLGAVAGLLAGIATVCFQMAVQRGMLSIAGVVASLYPAATVLLAATILRERVRGARAVGLALAAAALAFIAWR
jgi:drug/metabolite transporter (DMT)-like permease